MSSQLRTPELERTSSFSFQLEAVDYDRIRIRDVSQHDASTPARIVQLPMSRRQIAGTVRAITQSAKGFLQRDAKPGAVIDLGDRLHEMLFSSIETYNDYQAALNQRWDMPVRLVIDDSWVAELPWELLHDSATDHLLALSARTSVVRDTPTTPVDPVHHRLPKRSGGPLRVVVVPIGQDVEAATVVESLTTNAGGVRVEAVTDTAQLRKLVDSGDIQVLHLAVGDGYEGGSGFLDALGLDTQRTSALHLMTIDGTETSRWANRIAAAAVRPSAIVGMQGSISGQAASTFSYELYRSLGEGESLNDAVTTARRSVSIDNPGSAEWALPVLYADPTTAAGRVVSPDQTPAMLPETSQDKDRETRLLMSRLEIERANLRMLERTTSPSSYVENQLSEIRKTVSEIHSALAEVG